MTLLRQLEGFCGHLVEIKLTLNKRWEIFTSGIRTAYKQLAEDQVEAAVEILEDLLQEVGRPEVLVAQNRGAVRTRGGLISAYQQTPGKMNEDLVGPRIPAQTVNVERLNNILKRLLEEIQTVEKTESNSATL